MPNDLQLSDQDEVLLESLVLAASDNVARAPASDRDQFAPERRRAFVETSGNENVYLGTESEWVDVSENTGLLSKLFSGGDGNFDSVNTDRSRTKSEPVYNVKNWGAVGDGSTDDSGPIQDAIDAAAAAGGGTLFFPEPDTGYLIGSSLKPKDNVWYYGDGWPRLMAGDLGDFAMFENQENVSNARWMGLEFDGSTGWTQAGGYTPFQKAIFLRPGVGTIRDVWIQNCYVHDIPATPLGIDSCINDWYLYNVLENNGTDTETVGSNGIGVGVGEVEGLCPTYIIGNTIIDTAQYAIIFERTGGLDIVNGAYVAGNIIDGCRDAFGVEHTHGFSIVNNPYIANVDRDVFRVGALDGTQAPKYGTIGGNYADGAGQHAVNVLDEFVDGVFCENNNFQNITGKQLNLQADGSTVYWNGEGREAAGAGNTPTASGWEPEGYGKDVRNTDDGVIYRLNPDGTWTQLN